MNQSNIVIQQFHGTKMKFTIIVFVAFNLFVASQCALSRVVLEPLPDHPDKCYNSDKTVFYNIGDLMENKGGSECYEKQCLKSEEGEIVIHTSTCGLVQLDEPEKYCKKTGPYPDCCEYVQC